MNAIETVLENGRNEQRRLEEGDRVGQETKTDRSAI
jgi:hypothetical protein